MKTAGSPIAGSPVARAQCSGFHLLLFLPVRRTTGGGGAGHRPLRAIHVGPGLLRGGAEQWLVDLLRFLDPKRIQILRTIAVYPNLTDPDLTADLSIPVEVGQAESVRRAARECDVLLSWGLGLNNWLADCRPRLSVMMAHGEGDWTRKFLRESDRVIDHVIAVSRAVKDRCCDGFDTSVIYNGVDCSRLGRTRSREAVRASLGFQPGDFVLGYLGRYSSEKIRVPLLLEAAALLPPHFKVLMVGWGASAWRSGAGQRPHSRPLRPGERLELPWRFLSGHGRGLPGFRSGRSSPRLD